MRPGIARSAWVILLAVALLPAGPASLPPPVLAQAPTPGPATPTAEPLAVDPSADCQPRAALEAPVPDGPLRGIVPVGGWAVDLNSPAGTGVTDVHVYLDGYGIEAGHTFIGQAEYGGSRVDVAQQFNDARFARSAFSLSWDASTAGAGSHTLVVLYRTRCGWANLTQTVEVDGPTILLNVESPPQGSQVAAPVRLQGWAADPRATTGTGVERVELYLDGQVTTRGVPLGEVAYGESRPDVGRSLGAGSEETQARLSRSGFSMFWNPAGVAPGQHSLTIYARGPEGAVARSLTVDVSAAAARATPGPAGGAATARGGDAIGLTVLSTTPTSVSLGWVAAANALVYDVYVSEGVAAYFPAQTNLTDTRATVAGLVPGRSYRIYVRGVDATGAEVARSNTVSITTATAPLTPTPGPTSPPRPTPTATPGGF
jgi:hypothetical protein